MKSEQLFNQELFTMQKEKGNICVSIIVPTHRLSPERRVDKLEVERAIAHAKQLLQHDYDMAITAPLLQAIDELYETIDFNHNADGVGLYVSSKTRWIVHFPFPVKEKVVVGDNFELRDPLYKMNYADPYFVLLLTEKAIRLFEGSWVELKEIADGNFPQQYEESYSYEAPVRSAPHTGHPQVKSIEKDKSKLEEIRINSFFRAADELLDGYLVNDTPLIILGAKKELPWFENISSHKINIIDTISGNYNHADLKELAKIAWPVMHQHLQHIREQLILEFEEKIGEHLGISGISEVWQAALEGRAFKLLVEKDFCQPGFLKKDSTHLYLHPPLSEHRIIADAVDDIIELVAEKNGHIFFTDNDLLKDYQRIALITRY